MGKGAWIAAVVLGLATVGAIGDAFDNGPTDPAKGGGSHAAADPKSGTQSTSPSKPRAKASRRSAPKSTRKPEPKPEPRTYLVTRIVDGDTLELGNGETVRLAGIDTPEVGECGFEKASNALADLVLGEPVTLGASDEDRDRYGRLLRYVDRGRLDAGYWLIRHGLAIARYDSRDGYGFHPRETEYIAADAHSRNLTCSQPVPLVQQQPPAGNCAPGYDPCVPPAPPDLDCADVDGPIYVTGSDPHNFDADGDGVGCES